jgi:hypothetical protein
MTEQVDLNSAEYSRRLLIAQTQLNDELERLNLEQKLVNAKRTCESNRELDGENWHLRSELNRAEDEIEELKEKLAKCQEQSK